MYNIRKIDINIFLGEPFDKYFQDKWKIHPNWYMILLNNKKNIIF